MSLSFWIFLIVCVLSFFPALRESRGAWQALTTAKGKRDSVTRATHLLILLLVPLLTLAGTIVTGLESIAADRKAEAQSKELARLKSPRTITPEQRDAIIHGLRECPEKRPVVIQASVLDAEAMDFACQIESVLTNSGFSVHLPKKLANDASLAVGPPGLHIAVREPTRPFPSAARLQRSFISAGIEMPGINTTDCDTNTILICVGQK